MLDNVVRDVEAAGLHLEIVLASVQLSDVLGQQF